MNYHTKPPLSFYWTPNRKSSQQHFSLSQREWLRNISLKRSWPITHTRKCFKMSVTRTIPHSPHSLVPKTCLSTHAPGEEAFLKQSFCMVAQWSISLSLASTAISISNQTYTHKLSHLFNLTKQKGFYPFKFCSESYHMLTHTVHMQLFFSCLFEGTHTTELTAKYEWKCSQLLASAFLCFASVCFFLLKSWRGIGWVQIPPASLYNIYLCVTTHVLNSSTKI